MAGALAFIFIAGDVSAAAADTRRPVRMIVPFPPGGPTDALARVIAQKLTEALGTQVVVDNRGGANGIIGQDLAAKAPPDGRTMLIQSVAFAINPSLYKLPYDSERDFVPVSMIASTSLLLVVHPALPATSVKEIIDIGQRSALSYASFGTGSIAHLAAELFASSAHIELTHVPYKGVPQALTDLIAGRVQLMFPGISSALPHVEAGRLQGVAVTSRARSVLAPAIPTMIESGIPDYDIGSWFGVFLPGGATGKQAQTLHRTLSAVLGTPEVSRLFRSQGFEVIVSSPQAFERRIKADMAKFGRIVATAGIKVE